MLIVSICYILCVQLAVQLFVFSNFSKYKSVNADFNHSLHFEEYNSSGKIQNFVFCCSKSTKDMISVCFVVDKPCL